MVNKNLGKESGLTYNQVRDRYEHFRSRCLNKDETNPKIAKQSTDSKKVIEKGCTDLSFIHFTYLSEISFFGLSFFNINILNQFSKKFNFISISCFFISSLCK